MSKRNNKQVGAQLQSVPQETTQATTVEEYAAQICSAIEVEDAAVKTRTIGMGLPMSEIISAMDTIFDQATNTDRLHVKTMRGKIEQLLAFKYSLMSSTATHEVMVRINSKSFTMMAENELKNLRMAQLKHMQESKTDNIYRRIYNIGSRQEYGRFTVTNSMIVRVKKLNKGEEDSSE